MIDRIIHKSISTQSQNSDTHLVDANKYIGRLKIAQYKYSKGYSSIVDIKR